MLPLMVGRRAFEELLWGAGWRMRLSGLLRKVCREKKEPKTLCHLVESHGR